MGLVFSLVINHVVLSAMLEFGTPLYSMMAFYEFIGYNTLFTILIFQIPLAIKLLKNIKIITNETFKGYSRHIIIITLIVTGIITPDGTMLMQLFLTLFNDDLYSGLNYLN
jgi:Sec-independent protein secretion pathway component TatC